MDGYDKIGVDCCGDLRPCNTSRRCQCCNMCFCAACYERHCVDEHEKRHGKAKHT